MVMKCLSMFLLLVILLTFCSSPTSYEIDGDFEAQRLKVTNNACGIIKSVSLVGYDFQNLAIAEYESKTFNLLDGISAGLDNVNVIAKYINHGFDGDISVDFMTGQIASIELIKVKFPNECNAGYFGLQVDK